jgi:hypothetical protein
MCVSSYCALIHVSSYRYICVLIGLCTQSEMCTSPHTTRICVLRLLYMCPHVAVYVSSYDCVHLLMLPTYVSSDSYTCVLMSLYMCRHTTVYISSCYPHMCLQTPIHVSSCRYICVYEETVYISSCYPHISVHSYGNARLKAPAQIQRVLTYVSSYCVLICVSAYYHVGVLNAHYYRTQRLLKVKAFLFFFFKRDFNVSSYYSMRVRILQEASSQIQNVSVCFF